MSQLIIHAGDFIFQARFEEQVAPKTCAAFRKVVPFESQAMHVRWSGEGVWMPLGDLDFGIAYENHTSYPAPGQIILYPGGISETEILLAYGGVHFASKMGQLAGNHFIPLTSGLEKLATFGKARLWRMFGERQLPATVFGVATALKRNPDVVAAMKEAGWDIASHSLKWIEHKDMSEVEERIEIADAIRVHTEATGQRPLGWYTGRSSINTVRLVMEAGGFLCSCGSYPRDLPHWIEGPAGPHLIITHTLEADHLRFVNPQGFGGGDEFFTYLKDSFDVLYAEGETSPKMMSIGLHCRLVGRPG